MRKLTGLFCYAKGKDTELMISLEVIGIGAVISYGIALLMKLTLIGILCDIGYVLEHPFISMTIALFAEAGTVLTYPIARLMGLEAGAAAAVSMIGGADGPMVLFASLKLAPELFVPISIEGCTESCIKGKSGDNHS